jgi:cellulose synthase (UDP-forming)
VRRFITRPSVPDLTAAMLTATATAERTTGSLVAGGDTCRLRWPPPVVDLGEEFDLPAPERAAGRPAATDAHAESRHRSVGVLTRVQLARYWALALLWAVVTVSFWGWWLRGSVRGTPWLYWPQTVALFYQTSVLPAFFWFFVRSMRRPVEPEPQPGLRVAMITLCVPASESLDVIRMQLDALGDVQHPHDSWILDEGASDDVQALAAERGINYFSRRAVAAWNQPKPPFQAATKAGNVNAWLDHVGLQYDVFVQLDIDHRPRADYLDRVLGYFRDPEVAWVQAPSVCGNLETWSARGLAEQELVFQGPLQMGFYGRTRTPFIIGSHTSYRTSAIAEIGGFQPTRAEDHLDTVVLAAHGYTGVFVPELIAVGEGPRDFATYLKQQFAWAYSMIEIFLRHTPRLIRRYSRAQAFQFLMCQSWYTFWSVSLGVLWALPAIALIVHEPIATVRLGDFLVYFLPAVLASGLMWCEARRWFQPADLKLSWRGVVLEIARWPVVLLALVNVVLRIKRPYMITPKGVSTGQASGGLRVYVPYLLLVAIPIAAAWIFHVTAGGAGVQGYYGLALLNAAIALVVVATVGMMEGRRIALGPEGVLAAVRSMAPILVIVLTLLALLAVSVSMLWGPIVHVVA